MTKLYPIMFINKVLSLVTVIDVATRIIQITSKRKSSKICSVIETSFSLCTDFEHPY